MDEKKETAVTEATTEENVEAIDTEEAVDSVESEPEVSADQVDEEAESQETFGEADILSEPEAAPGEDGTDQMRHLEQQLATALATLDEREAQYKRIAADFENFRRRTQKEKSDLEDQVKCNTITELLPVIDNFERARAQIKPQTDAEMNIHKSYQGVYKQLVDCLKRMGVSPMRSEGEVFDPNLHEAVMREPTTEYDDGVVIEDLMRGYMLNERVLRHAMVKVAAAMDGDPAPADDGEENQE